MTGETARDLAIIILLASWVAGAIGMLERMSKRGEVKQDKKPPLRWD